MKQNLEKQKDILLVVHQHLRLKLSRRSFKVLCVSHKMPIFFHTGGSINPEGGCGVDPHPLMQWCTSEVMLMIMIAGRRKVQKDGHMQIVCHTSGNLRPMSWVGVHFIFRLPLYIFILGAPHPFNPGSPRHDQPYRPNIGQTGIKSLYFLSLSKAPQTFPY